MDKKSALVVVFMSTWSWLWMGFLISTTFSLELTLALNITSSSEPKSHSTNHHKCYVCLPPDKSSAEAQEILSLFSKEKEKLKDCLAWGASANKTEFELRCPGEYRGCLMRIIGTNVSRSCAKFQFNDCKTANNKELCFCSGSLCNGERESIKSQSLPHSSSPSSEEEEEEDGVKKVWQKGETDDEDLLEMADDTGLSGDGPYPPGVIDQYTTTPKPTLVPNLRGDPRFKTTPPPPPTSGAGKDSCSLYFRFNILLSCVVIGSWHFSLFN